MRDLGTPPAEAHRALGLLERHLGRTLHETDSTGRPLRSRLLGVTTTGEIWLFGYLAHPEDRASMFSHPAAAYRDRMTADGGTVQEKWVDGEKIAEKTYTDKPPPLPW